MKCNADSKIYSGIDLFKLIAAILVVFLHAVETNSWYPNEIKYVFTSLAVPFFFITSGFFFFKGLEKSSNIKDYFVRYEKNLINIFMIWALVIYLPFEIITYVTKYSGESIWKICLYLIRRIFVIGPGPYWYLIALMWSAAFLYLCHIKGKNWLLYSAIIFGLMLEILYSCFQGCLGSNSIFSTLFSAIYFLFSWEFNFIMFGIPFMGIGYLIAAKKIFWTTKTSVTILLLSTFARILEYQLPIIYPSDFWLNNSVSIAFIIQAIAYFMLAKSINLKIKRKTSLLMRQLSSFIYYFHLIFLYEILNPLLKITTNLDIYADSLILLKVAVTIVVCFFLYVVIKRIDHKRLNILING